MTGRCRPRVTINPGLARVKAEWDAATVRPTPHVEDALLVDVDGDGAVDVVSCCEGSTRTIFVHWAPSDAARFQRAEDWSTEAIPASK